MKIVIYIERPDRVLKWEDCSKAEQKKIARVLNLQAASALGYKLREV